MSRASVAFSDERHAISRRRNPQAKRVFPNVPHNDCGGSPRKEEFESSLRAVILHGFSTFDENFRHFKRPHIAQHHFMKQIFHHG
jgi:hypothetical protein